MQAIKDSKKFLIQLPEDIESPEISIEDDDVYLYWKRDNTSAEIGFVGDSMLFGYLITSEGQEIFLDDIELSTEEIQKVIGLLQNFVRDQVKTP